MTDSKVIVPEFKELTFDENGHIYRLNGGIVPSVTTLMKPLTEPYFQSIDQDVLARAADRGTVIHNAVENYAKFEIEDIDPMYAGYFEGFKTWWDLRKPEPIAMESRVYHKILRYAGTVDLLCILDGELTLVDYKTSAQANGKLWSIQLEGYDRAYESHGIKIKNRVILHLGKDGRHQEIPFKRDTKNWVLFTALLTVYNYTHE